MTKKLPDSVEANIAPSNRNKYIYLQIIYSICAIILLISFIFCMLNFENYVLVVIVHIIAYLLIAIMIASLKKKLYIS